ncbi:MAG: MogA/MoaB family molybdenum cofactor biosynthesis protein [Desulfurococcales archaeon]|nr:MogA/MoaB family molybdenum cofactor biosynthesis protein [Desulfurococcales archaeon]
MRHPHEIHRERGPKSVSVFVLTISTSRYIAMQMGRSYTDESGDLIVSAVERAGHRVVGRLLIGDDRETISRIVGKLLHREDVDVIIATGGTGISKTDTTVEAIRPLLEKEIEGFGEIFRFLSYQKIGPSAILSRALAGIARGKLLVALPGSPDAVKTGLDLILPEIPHILYLARG